MSTPPLRVCAWCRVNPVTDVRARFCSRKCRQAAHRLRRRRATEAEESRTMRMAYADPPYPGTARKWYGDQPNFARRGRPRRLDCVAEGLRIRWLGALDLGPGLAGYPAAVPR